METLAEMPNSAVLRAIRAQCPGVPISLTTRADFKSDPRLRLEMIARWSDFPELVSANQGRTELPNCEHLIARRGGIEGHGIRIGLEDTTLLPDRRRAAGNAELLRPARALPS